MAAWAPRVCGAKRTWPTENLADRWEGLHNSAALKEMRGRCVLFSHLDLNYGVPEKAARPFGSSKTESAKSAQALAKASAAKLRSRSRNYLVKNRQPSFGNGHPNQVLIGDCLAVYCEKHGPTIARPDGLALEVDRLAEFFGDRLVSELTEELSATPMSRGAANKPTSAQRKTRDEPSSRLRRSVNW